MENHSGYSIAIRLRWASAFFFPHFTRRVAPSCQSWTLRIERIENVERSVPTKPRPLDWIAESKMTGYLWKWGDVWGFRRKKIGQTLNDVPATIVFDRPLFGVIHSRPTIRFDFIPPGFISFVTGHDNSRHRDFDTFPSKNLILHFPTYHHRV